MFEMDKTYRETRLQLLLSPVLLSSSDLSEREEREEHLKVSVQLYCAVQNWLSIWVYRCTSVVCTAQNWLSSWVLNCTAMCTVQNRLYQVLLKAGNMLLTGLQFRGHAMFSEIDRPLGEDTLEYAWLMEIQCGNLVGKITVPQLYNISQVSIVHFA